MTKYTINKTNIDAEFQQAYNMASQIVAGGGHANLEITKKSSGTLSMLRLWRGVWMVDMAEFQARRGAKMPILAPQAAPSGEIVLKTVDYRAFDENDAHEVYTRLFLGCDDNGERYSWALGKDEHEGRTVATLGQRLDAMRRFHLFCIEHAVPIRIPRNNEYSQLIEAQEQ